ncbi:NepR family anti-sigma factor [Rhodovulum sulfidophilum]|nr:NepR family anti-sigma factor [Rhodovulum sulfidophilum]MCE8421024.1 RNA polymerase subunit sigma-70 [Rhodovulum sulfidophilum]MCE8430710.1 RNA polymerase subunit sigma-70 [Rhodovulum sulfidophilum]MCE8439026.1 RNA polymerase subunit sigma-70 [Rhodovulum sulfidophilum]MCE8455671.1 RNA polymerase subunit sigma-70 [Rhodovulum sulfidophilum]MCE8469984.1 RNA polymerase subunit sigma-70 [Rhodovulum sulfidophilum]
MEEQIDDNLRRVYAQAVEEQVPDRFLKLLEQLRGAGAEASNGSSGKGSDT